MADEDDIDDLDADGDDIDLDDGGQPKKSKTKLIVLVLVPLLLIGGGAAAFMAGMLDPLLGDGKVAEGGDDQRTAAGPAVYYDLPQMVVNLNTAGRRSNFLKIVVSLEVAGQEDVKRVQEAMPRIVDNFQVYLRELRIEDLRGSAGIYRLREELLFRVNTAANPARVTDVLFKEMLVQ